jgi:Co/Zn/Cd efflux system component
VIAAWAVALVRDTSRVLVDFTPDVELEKAIRQRIEEDGDCVRDLHLWRLGPGHLGAIVSVATSRGRGCDYYRSLLGRFEHLSHVTIEVKAGS